MIIIFTTMRILRETIILTKTMILTIDKNDYIDNIDDDDEKVISDNNNIDNEEDIDHQR